MKRLNLVPLVLLVLSLAAFTANPAQAQERRRAASNEVRISPSAMHDGDMSIDISPGSWSARGFDLKTLIAQVYDIDPRRIDLPANVDTKVAYDVTLALTGDEDRQAITLLLKRALERKFALSITPESRSMDVYVLTAPNGPGPALRPHVFSKSSRSRGHLQNVSVEEPELATRDLPQFTYEGQTCPTDPWARISASAGTVSGFGRTLEQDLDRLLVDETRLTGSYDFQTTKYRGTEELFQVLREQLGLVVVPARRDVVVLTVRLS